MVSKEINLIPGGREFKFKNTQWLYTVVPSIIILGLVLVVFMIIPKMQIKKLSLENAKLAEEIASVSKIDEKMTEYEKKQAELKSKRDLVDIIVREKMDVSEFLREISNYLPQNVYITQMSINSGQSLVVSFSTNNPVDTARIMVKLQEMNKFEGIELSSVPIDNKENVVKFNLKLKGNKDVQGSSAKAKVRNTDKVQDNKDYETKDQDAK